MEDYEYMTMAASLDKTEDVDGIAPSFEAWSKDPEAYELAREQLVDLILKNKNQ